MYLVGLCEWHRLRVRVCAAAAVVCRRSRRDHRWYRCGFVRCYHFCRGLVRLAIGLRLGCCCGGGRLRLRLGPAVHVHRHRLRCGRWNSGIRCRPGHRRVRSSIIVGSIIVTVASRILQVVLCECVRLSLPCGVCGCCHGGWLTCCCRSVGLGWVVGWLLLQCWEVEVGSVARRCGGLCWCCFANGLWLRV